MNLISIKGVSDKKAAVLKRMGIDSAEDVLSYFPRRFTDLNKITSIAETQAGTDCAVMAKVTEKLRPILGKTALYKLRVSDGTGSLVLLFWGKGAYFYQQLVVGVTYIFHGRVTVSDYDGAKQVSAPVFILPDDTEKMLPRYRLTQGISNAVMTAAVRDTFALYKDAAPDGMPPLTDLRELLAGEAGVLSLAVEKFEKSLNLTDDKTLYRLHFPENEQQYLEARKRLVFEELLSLQLKLRKLRRGAEKTTAHVLTDSDTVLTSVGAAVKKLPFVLTKAQSSAVDAVCADFCKNSPMNRLLQGDVGSGKTVVAFLSAVAAYHGGWQSCVMAPTEVLAKQHFATFKKFCNAVFGEEAVSVGTLGLTDGDYCEYIAEYAFASGDESCTIRVALLTGAMTAKEKKRVNAGLADGSINIVTGTHALVQKTAKFKNLGFIVVDEQHRFGVEQREILEQKGSNPHVLVMSATPIPRTLALTIYADLDVSVLDELPAGRIPIETYGVDSSFLPRLYEFIKKEAAAGHKSYIVCPLIELEADSETDETSESKPKYAKHLPFVGETTEKASAVKYQKNLQDGVFKDLTVGLLHGKMKQSEKDAVMDGFKNAGTQVLVATTVIEVGVDVPEATVMLILNAEQFGLSQLHQLRGRVGRGTAKSYCVLVTDSQGEYTKARIDIMKETRDGFKIAREDLTMRGPGDFFGTQQHGLPKMKFAGLWVPEDKAREIAAEDMDMLEQLRGIIDDNKPVL